MKNQKGFSSDAIILILVIVQIISSSCWHVSEVRQAVEKKPDNVITVSESRAEQAGNQKAQSSETDETSGWKSYVSAEGKFSLRYPKKWAVGSRFHDELGEVCPEIFLAAPDAELLGQCATEYFGLGQISVTSIEGDHIRDRRLTASYPYLNIARRKVMVNNTEGLRESGTAKDHDDEKFILQGLPDGAKVVIYSFYAHGRTYVAQYIQRSGNPNVLREFDLMITKTLKFDK
jgi:hypothetical protein